MSRISSYDQATVGTGSVVNEVKSAYNDFAQPITSWQAHNGAVDTMTTPKVQYEYADGSDNTIRPTAILYPNGRQLDYNYGSAHVIDDSLSRVAAIVDESSSVNLAQYEYLGAQAVVRIDSPQADLQYTLVDLSETNDPDTGDIYSGLDRFGRVKDVRWRNTDTAADLSRVQYGYNRASNRIWRKNPTDPNEQYDWLYTYDGLQRLKDAQRGTLNAPHTALSSQDFAQCWSLDATGNWQQFRQADEGSSWSLEQQRTANPVNEITGIENSVGPAWAQPAYDANGNMTTIPHPTGGQSLASSSSSSSSEEIPAGFTGTYDAWNRLVKLADAETAATVQENQYDGRYFRTVRKDFAEGTLDQTRHFYYTNDWRCVEERLDTNTTPDRHFVWGVRYIDDLICRDRSTTGTLNERLYALPDGNWNVTALVNTSGAVVKRLEYDPYGNTTWLTAGFAVEVGSQFGWEVTYCSYHWDATTGILVVRFREYYPHAGCWTRRDPAGHRDGMNLYAYAMHSPLSSVDPYGLECTPGLTIRVYTEREDAEDIMSLLWHGSRGQKSTSLAELRKMIESKIEKEKPCKACISELNILGHGLEGTLIFSDDEALTGASPSGELKEFLDFLKPHMCDNSKIEFTQCYSGEGEEGDRSLCYLAKTTKTLACAYVGGVKPGMQYFYKKKCCDPDGNVTYTGKGIGGMGKKGKRGGDYIPWFF